MHIFMHIHMYICICIYIYMWKYKCTYICIYIYLSYRFTALPPDVEMIHEAVTHTRVLSTTHISIWKHAHTPIYKSVFTHIHHRFTALPVDGDMMDEGVMHIRVLEPKVLGEPRSVGTASMPLRVDILKFSSKVILHVHFSSSWLLRISPTSLALSAKLACPCG